MDILILCDWNWIVELLLSWIFCNLKKIIHMFSLKFILRAVFSFMFEECFTAASSQYSVIFVAIIGTINFGRYKFPDIQIICNIYQNLFVILVITVSFSLPSFVQMLYCNLFLSLTFLHFIQRCLSFIGCFLLTLFILVDQALNEWMMGNRKFEVCGGNCWWPHLSCYPSSFQEWVM
jgi:hypothetical protein